MGFVLSSIFPGTVLLLIIVELMHYIISRNKLDVVLFKTGVALKSILRIGIMTVIYMPFLYFSLLHGDNLWFVLIFGFFIAFYFLVIIQRNSIFSGGISVNGGNWKWWEIVSYRWAKDRYSGKNYLIIEVTKKAFISLQDEITWGVTLSEKDKMEEILQQYIPEKCRETVFVEKAEKSRLPVSQTIYPIDSGNIYECIEACEHIIWMYQEIAKHGGFVPNIDFANVQYKVYIIAEIIDERLKYEEYLEIIALMRQGSYVALCCKAVNLLTQATRSEETIEFVRTLLLVESVQKQPFEKELLEIMYLALQEQPVNSEEYQDWTRLDNGSKFNQKLVEVYERFVLGYYKKLLKAGECK